MTVEERLSALEKQVAELQQRLAALEPRASWLDRLTGSMKDFPEFEEVLRFGREIREADRPPDEPSAEG
jgi:hypothetical protein